MKITYFKAKNFIGIYAGTGRTEIEIDFEKNNLNDIILLLGDNGSGKSTLMSIANPFRETFDSRKNIILPEKEGYKEIHLQDGKDKYVIVHHYGKTSSKNKSYISKNGVELNENGNIGSFAETLMEKFNLTKDYFTIGKVGSNVEGFIGLSTANRKSYINKFIPNIDEYLEAFEVVNEKYKQCNKDIKSLKSSLDKMNEDDLLISKSQIETNIQLVTSEIKNKEKEYNTSEIRIENIKESIKDVPENIKDLYIDSKKKYEQEKLRYNGYLAKYPKLASYDKKSITDKVTENKIAVNKLNDELDSINSSISSADNGITSNELEKVRFEHLKGEIYENFIKPSEIKVSIFNDKNELKIHTNNLDTYKQKLEEFKLIGFAMSNDYTTARNETDTLFNTIKNIKDSYSLSTINETIVSDEMKYYARYKSIEKQNETISIELEDIRKKIFYLENNHKKHRMVYDKKPVDCKISTCAFIKDAENFILNEYPLLESLIEKEKELSDTLNKNNLELDVLKDRINYIDAIERYVLNSIENHIFLNHTIDFNNIDDLMKNTTYHEERVRNEIACIKEYYLAKDNIARLDSDIERNNSLLEINEQKEKLISEYDSNIAILDNESAQLQEKLDELNQLKADKSHEIQVKKNTNKLFDIFSELINTFEEYSKEYELYEEMYNNSLDKLEEIDNLENSMIAIKRNIADNENKLAMLNKDVEKVKNELYLFETYSSKLKEIETSMQDLETVKEALDPKKGIPLIFMNNYLNIIGANANELLDKAYGGDFKIAFDVTPKDFMINVYKADGTKLNDISEASQGETSLTTIALSLAMMENLLKDCKYNILYLDEVDATLSTANRRIFLELLKVQMEKNIEQCFVISHNDEFYSHPIDMILFKGNKIDKEDPELMDNKNIIWELK